MLKLHVSKIHNVDVTGWKVRTKVARRKKTVVVTMSWTFTRWRVPPEMVAFLMAKIYRHVT